MIRFFFILTLFLNSAILKAQDINYEEWYMNTSDSVRIFVKELRSQSKDTVIVVHGGFGANHDYMLDAVKGLEGKFHFIFYDQRGSLLSPTSLEKMTFAKNVNDLYELVIKLRLKKVKLLCHSMGTLVGMEFTKLYPNLVSKLVLAGAILPKADSISNVFSEQMIKNLTYLENRQEVKNEKKYYINNKEHLTDKEKTEYWRISFAEANIYNISKWKLLKGGQIYYNEDAYVITQSVNWNYDYRSTLSKRNATIIQGQYDFLDFNLKNYKDKLEGYKNIELKIIPNAGHNSWIDNPILFRKYLYEALTK